MNMYLVGVQTFEELAQTAIKLSIKSYNKQVDCWEKVIGSDIFERICAISYSLLKLIPESVKYEKDSTIDIWDYSSICILTRSLLDSYLIYFHYCIDIPSDVHERNFKQQFWNYYIDYKKIKMLDLIRTKHYNLQRNILLRFIQNLNIHSKNHKIRHLNKKQDFSYSIDSVVFWQNSVRRIISFSKNSRELKRIKHVNHSEISAIKLNQFYQQQTNSLKNRIEKCEIFQIPSNNEIAIKCGFSNGFYKSTYDYLSRYTHSDSFCLDQLAVFKAGSRDSYHLIGTTLDYLRIILSFAIRDFVRIHPELTMELNDFIKTIIIISEKNAKAF